MKDGSKPILHLFKNREPGAKVFESTFGKDNSNPYKVGQVSVMRGKVKKTDSKVTEKKKTTKQRQQKAGVDKLAKMYNMESNGVILAKPGIDRVALEEWVKSLGFKMKTTKGDRGQTTSYQLMKDGKRYKPGDEKKSQRQQIVFTESETPVSIINKSRELGFNNPEIKDVLIANTDLKVTEINTLLKVPVNAFKNLPESFINVKGGIKQGLSTFKKVNEFITDLNKKNQKLENPLTQEQLATKAIENQFPLFNAPITSDSLASLFLIETNIVPNKEITIPTPAIVIGNKIGPIEPNPVKIEISFTSII